NMNTIARKLSVFVLMAAAATTALTMGATTTFAASNTHTHHIQLMGNDDSWASSFTHTPINSTGTVGSDDFGGFNSAQYGWSHPHHHHGSTDMIADYGDNSNSTAGSDDRGGFSSAQYGSSGSHSHHHLNSTPNSSWMWPTHHSASDIVDLN
ncbi:MAG: hypothetical protein WBZ36_01870, partial [Candidatus Nitrosopolaris sp.]